VKILESAKDGDDMDQVLARIEGFGARTGIKPSLQITLNLTSKYDHVIDLLTVNSRTWVYFSERGMTVSPIPNQYAGDALVERPPRTLNPGDANSITLLLPIDFDLLGGIEDSRQAHDLEVSLNMTFNGIERQQQGTVGQRVVAGDVLDARNGTQAVIATITKSRWAEFLNEWQYSAEKRRAAEEFNRTIR